MQCAKGHATCEMEKIYHEEIKGDFTFATADTYQCPTCGTIKSKLSSKGNYGKFTARIIDGMVSLDDIKTLNEITRMGKLISLP
ncbi:hypothetical protein HYT26_01440 [Candidatus Pacearchaeota archaeon]|nr:hypothetical protein [Candidatus Pacearchaeota archaeon]